MLRRLQQMFSLFNMTLQRKLQENLKYNQMQQYDLKHYQLDIYQLNQHHG